MYKVVRVQACAVFSLLLALCVTTAEATEIQFPETSYQALGYAEEMPIPNAALFVIADESVGFDKNMINRANKMIYDWLKPGRYVEIMRFSSGVKGRYTEVVTAGRLDPEPSEAFLNNLKRSTLAKFKKRHHQQLRVAKIKTQKAFLSILKTSNKSVPHSDIISNMKAVSAHIKNFPAQRKVLFVLSDMLENSSVTTFYSSGHVKRIDPEKVIAVSKRLDMMADFGEDVTVYVLGLGYFWKGEGSSQEKYLDPIRASKIAKFWEMYFEESHATIGEIGKPLMYQKIK
ncbi:MAG: hypothetical protein Q9N02_04675 [Ghiorsea sp.]|nr:hypothetical protein [Ghiorsea sp.]